MHRNLVFGVVILTVCTLASGVIQGRLSNRWGKPEDLREAGDLLEQMPTTAIGDWACVQNEEIGDEALKELESVGSFSRTYTNDKGESIRLFAIVGPRGPTVAHTPDVCYSSRAYTFSGERTRIEISTADGKTHSFWSRKLTSNDEFDPHTLDVCHAWSTGGVWTAPDYRRLSYLTSPSLYKLQLAYQIPESQEDSQETISDFLRQFLPVLSQYMK